MWVRLVTTSSRANPSAAARFCESVESGHTAHDTAATIADLLHITQPPVRLDSQAKYAVVARGDADIYMRLPTRPNYQEKIWDHAGGTLLVEEAGGRVTDINGKPLDWSAYKDKTVLVNFYSAKNENALTELNRIARQRTFYHDRGLRIVGISLDAERPDLDAFLEKEKLPWTILFAADEDNPSEAADYYGVMGIPTMILVGPDGKVVSTRARGEILKTELEQLLGPIEEDEEEAAEEDTGAE